MNKYYFPPCGFGFWYQLGVLKNISLENSKIYGSSAGSLICLASLLKEDDREFNKLLKICLKIQEDINNKNFFSKFNMYNYVDQFSNKMLKIINTYPNNKIEKKLSNISIEVTRINWYYIFPYFTKEIITPKNLVELKTLIIGSCYIPLISYCNNPFYFNIDNKMYIDGYFSNLFYSKNKYVNINSNNYRGIIPCTPERALVMYQDGTNYKFNNLENKGFLTKVFEYIQKILDEIIIILLGIY